MENLTDNAQGGANTELDAAKAMYAEWKKNQSKTTKTKPVTREDALKKHFVPREALETFRPLHPNINEQYVKFAFFHEVLLNKAGGKKQRRKVYCPASNDPQIQALDNEGKPVFNEQGKPVMINKPCSICEASKQMLTRQDNENGKLIAQKLKNKQPLTPEEQKIKDSNDKIYKEAKRLEHKKYFMVKGIDRGKEKDGPKFWRFKDRFRQDGVGDKLVPTLFGWSEANGIHFANKEKGIDVNIMMVENSIPGSNYTYMDVSGINTDPRGPSPLHRDPSIADAWMADKTTWRDVYKPLQYKFMESDVLLDRVARGTDPFWDDTNSNDKKWVFPDPRDAELAVKVNTRSTNLDAKTERNFERASDVPETNETAAFNVVDQNSQPSMYDISKDDVSKDTEDALNITPQPKKEFKEETVPEQPPVATKAEETKVTNVVGNTDIEELDLPF